MPEPIRADRDHAAIADELMRFAQTIETAAGLITPELNDVHPTALHVAALLSTRADLLQAANTRTAALEREEAERDK